MRPPLKKKKKKKKKKKRKRKEPSKIRKSLNNDEYKGFLHDQKNHLICKLIQKRYSTLVAVYILTKEKNGIFLKRDGVDMVQGFSV